MVDGPAVAVGEARPDRRRRQRLVAVAVLVGIWLAFTGPVFVGKVRFPVDYAAAFPGPPASRVTPPGQAPSNVFDADAYFALYPFHFLLGEQLGKGHLPLWDTSRFLGVPYAANVGNGTFYPPNWLYAVGDSLHVEALIWSITILLCLLSAFWFLSLVELHPFAAGFGAVVWTFCGYMSGWGNHDPVIQAAVWLPLALGGLELARRGRPRWGVPLAAVALALSILAGQLQTSLYVWFIVALWAGVTAVAAAVSARRGGAREVGRRLVRAALPVLCAFAMGLGLASIQILGVLQFSTQTTRQKVSYATAVAAPRGSPVAAGRLQTDMLATLLIPDFHGNPLNNNYDYHGALPNYTQTTMYVGVLVGPLLIAGFFSRRRRLLAFFALVTTIGALSAFGNPFYHVVFTLVPGMNRLPAIQRFIFLIDVGLAGLAALGLDVLLSRASPRAGRAAITAAVVEGAGIVELMVTRWDTPVAAGFIHSRGERGLAVVALGAVAFVLLHRFPRLVEVAAVALVVLAGADLWIYGIQYHPFAASRPVYGPSPQIAALAAVPGARPRFVQVNGYAIPPNGSMVYHLYSLNGYDEFIPARLAKLLGLVDPAVPAAAQTNFIPTLRPVDARSPVLDLLGVTTVIAPYQAAPGAPAANGPSFAALTRPGAFPPAFVTNCWQPMADADVLGRMAGMSAPELRSIAVVSGQIKGAPIGPSPATCAPGSPATVRSYGSTRVALSTNSPQPGVLVLSDQWYPGWHVTVDGRSAPVLLVDYTLRGVALGPGPHTVTFVYQPSWPLEGLGITGLTVSACVLGVLLGLRRRRAAAAVAPAPPPIPALVPTA